MLRKWLLVFIFIIGVVGSNFAQDFSVSIGAGGLVTYDFGGGFDGSSNLMGYYFNEKIEMPYLGYGGFIFFDATYVELSAGAFYAGGNVKANFDTNIFSIIPGFPFPELSLPAEVKENYLNINIGLLLKYPFSISDRIKFFPLLGIDYKITLKHEIENGLESTIDNKEFNALWVRGGVGLDFLITENVFIRFDGLYGIRLENKFEEKIKSSFDDEFKKAGMSVDSKVLLGHGFIAKIAVGYKF